MLSKELAESNWMQPAHYPLHLTGTNWSFSIQSRPHPAIIMTGARPTRDEIISALTAIYAPAWMVPVVEALAQLPTQQTFHLTPQDLAGSTVVLRPADSDPAS